jgi:hypothetical protein
MKCQSLSCLAILALVAAAAGADDTTPVEKVVNMLTDLKGHLVADGKSEEQTYNKYACWCEKTSARKASDITEAENELRAVGQQILKLKGQVDTLTAEIKELNENLEENNEEQEQATALRAKQNAKYQEMTAETKEAIAALEKAIEVLGKGSSALLQTDTAMQAMSAVQSVLDKLPTEGLADNDHMSLLSEFSKNGADAKYAPQSATIQGILTDMYNTFATNVEDATKTEASQNHEYEDLMDSLKKEAANMNKVKSRKEDEKAGAESDLADATATYDETQDSMKADIKFFDEANSACDAKHEEWTVRQKMRAEELAGVEKALEFLTSDEARDLFAKSIKPGVEAASFLQIADSVEAVSVKAYGMLKVQATKTKSLRLASLAVQVRTAKVGHFDEVIKAIDEMIGTLNEEGAADRDKKNQCNEEYQSIAKTLADLEWKIKNNDATIDKKERLIDMRTKEKEETIEQIEEANKYQKDITDDRKAENDAFIQAKQDDEAAIKLLNMAKDALTAFYDKNDEKLGKIQGTFLQADPAFAVSEDQAPEAKLSGKGNRKGLSKGIVSLMEYVIQDLEDEVTNGKKDEAKNQASYEAAMQTSDELLADLKSKVSSLEDMIAKRGQEKTEEKNDRNKNIEDHDAETSYKNKIKPDCDWIKSNFDGRATGRAAEMSGLVSAKEFLAGKTSLLQLKVEVPVKPHTVSEDKLAGIRFLGVQ